MRIARVRWWPTVLGVASILGWSAILPSPADAQQASGAVSGLVVEQTTGQPLAGAQVTVLGTNLGTLTNAAGRYMILNVPAGQVSLRVIQVGHRSVTQEVQVSPGETSTLNFQLSESAVALEGIMVTATGQLQRRREVGSTVANINVADVDLAPVQTFSQLLQGRAAGVTVLQSAGSSGTGARIRIRGSNSISLSNEPMIVVDGIQVDNSPSSFALGIGGQSISRLNDFSPEEIESIEILKGPAASALYGTAAANGVIQITTKRGRSGAARWNIYTEYGQLKDVTDYPANYQGRGTDTLGVARVCRTYQAADGECTPTEVRSWNPLMEVPPFRTGISKAVGLNVSGGTDQVQYFVSGVVEGEVIPNLRIHIRA